VAGDRSVWCPGGTSWWELWTHLRLEFCRSVWRLTARRSGGGLAFTAAAVVEMTAAELTRSIRLDWARVGAGQGSGVEARRVRLDLSDFADRWLMKGVLAEQETDGTLRVHVPTALPPF